VTQRARAIRNSESGFTLTELLITIVILGVLAGIVVFAVSAFSDDGQKVACETDRKSVEVAAEAFRARTGAYPSGTDDAARLGVLVSQGYLKEAPSTTNGYTITLSSAGAVGPADCTP
jgi:general secretion pathway protein G